MRGILLILIALVATPTLAKTPWYAGVGAGMTNYQSGSALDALKPIDLDSWEAGFQLFGGYQLNNKWAVEAGYIDFGKADDYQDCWRELIPSVCLGQGFSYESTGLYFNGQYHIPVAKTVSLDLQGGWLFGKAKGKQILEPNTPCCAQSSEDNDNGAMLGLAFSWHGESGFGVRGSANYFLVDYDSTIKKPWRLGIDLLYNF